jgi:predicted AAA+ superfamily ATPase
MFALSINMNVEDLDGIIADQALERSRPATAGGIIDRENLPFWKVHSANDLIKVTTGARRSGKTTFSHLLMGGRDYAFVNFDDERLAFLGREDLNYLLERLYIHYGEFKHLLLDEVQNIHGWELFVNRLQRIGIEVFVTGSNANLLGEELATHLTGRVARMETLPFSFREHLVFNKISADPATTSGRARLQRSLGDYIATGGFPEAVKRPQSAKMYLAELFSSIIAKDVVARYRIRYVKTLKEMAVTLVSNPASLTTFNKLKNIHSVKSVHTVKNYMDYLSGAYLLQMVDRYSPKPKEVANSPKKVYAIDTGMVNALSVASSENRGAIMENIVFLDLMRRRSVEPGLEIYYWRDYQDYEVDFVLRKGKRIQKLLQVSYATGPDDVRDRETRALVKCAGLVGCKDLVLVTWDFGDDIRKDGRKIACKPLWRWLMENPIPSE